MPCAAPAERGQPETRHATRDSDIRLSFSLSASTARRCAQGDPIQASSLSLAQGRALLCRLRLMPNPTRTKSGAGFRLTRQRRLLLRAWRLYSGPLHGDGDAQRRRVSGALRRCGKVFEHRQSDASFCRIPSPRASECTGAKRRRCVRVSFSFAYFLLDKQKKVSRTAVRNKRCDELVSAENVRLELAERGPATHFHRAGFRDVVR